MWHCALIRVLRSYQALFDLCKMLLGNPFGNRRIDVAHDSIGQRVAAFSRSVAAGTPHLPPTMTPGVTVAWNNSESPENHRPEDAAKLTHRCKK